MLCEARVTQRMAKTHLTQHMREFGLATRATFIKEECEVRMDDLVFQPDHTGLRGICHEQVVFRNEFGENTFRDLYIDDELIG